jgi:hypothetical protein
MLKYAYLLINYKHYFCSVKLLSHIFTWYVLMLSIVPCCAADSCDDDIIVVAEKFFHTADEDEACQNCSPLAACSCCVPTFARAVQYTLVEARQHLAQIIIVGESHFFLGLFSDKIWQPPRRVPAYISI